MSQLNLVLPLACVSGEEELLSDMLRVAAANVAAAARVGKTLSEGIPVACQRAVFHRSSRFYV